MSLGIKPVELDGESGQPSGLTQLPIRNSNVLDVVLWLLRRRQRFRVVGVSMLPVLQPTDEVLVDPWAYGRSLPTPGEIIAIVSPNCLDLRLIKRVIWVRQSGACFVQGDNSRQSTDSRTFGWVEPHLILGRVTCRFL